MSTSNQLPPHVGADPTRAARRNALSRCLLSRAIVVTGIAVLIGILPTLRTAHAEKQSICITTNFRVKTFGGIPAGTTFWVAYGPVAGRFHAVRLHRTLPGVFSAHRLLPAHQSTVFTYLSARGTVRTPAGLEPGNDITVIDTIGPAAPARLTAYQVTWHQPAG